MSNFLSQLIHFHSDLSLSFVHSSNPPVFCYLCQSINVIINRGKIENNEELCLETSRYEVIH